MCGEIAKFTDSPSHGNLKDSNSIIRGIEERNGAEVTPQHCSLEVNPAYQTSQSSGNDRTHSYKC